jgi:hypothetical protein
MKVFYNKNNLSISFETLNDFVENVNDNIFYLSNSRLVISTDSLFDRYFVCLSDEKIYISDTLSFIRDSVVDLEINFESVSLYKKYGYIPPPYTQYSGVYIITPYREYMLCDNILVKDIYPDFSLNSTVENALSEYFNEMNFVDSKFNILVSGGIDSSALLGFINKLDRIDSSYMCQMSSMLSESERAKSICSTINVPFNLISLDKDLSSTAELFFNETGEIISDSIAIIMPELFKQISKDHSEDLVYLVDGQGADSLLNGLPLNKIYHYWEKLRYIRYLFYPFSHISIYNNKSTSWGRKLYRLTKAIKCLSQPNFEKAVSIAMTENELMNESDVRLHDRLLALYQKYKDWHFVLRFYYLFDVLPVREMQKYLLANRYNIKMVTPFLSSNVINKLICLDNSETIKSPIFKYPITKLAMNYWPSFFNGSSTSPFQVDFSLGHKNIKEFSLLKLGKQE